jgi:hypothetical protein
VVGRSSKWAVLEEGNEQVGRVGVAKVHKVVHRVGVGIEKYQVGWRWGVCGWKVYGRWL